MANPSLPLDSHALPKRNVILNLRGRGLRLRIIPSRVVVPHSSDFHAVVMRGTLPRALRRMCARLQELLLDRVRWEILVSFHLHGRIAFRNHFPAPASLGHFLSPYICAKICHADVARQISSHAGLDARRTLQGS